MDARWGYNLQTYYLRSVGGKWEPVSIEQMKKDLGHITVTAQQDRTLAISNISMTYADALAALKKGAHLQLMLSRADGYTVIYPAVAYTDASISFIMLPAHDTAWAVTWTENGMMMSLDGGE